MNENGVLVNYLFVFDNEHNWEQGTPVCLGNWSSVWKAGLGPDNQDLVNLFKRDKGMEVLVTVIRLPRQQPAFRPWSGFNLMRWGLDIEWTRTAGVDGSPIQGKMPTRPTEITSKGNASDGQTRTACLTPHISILVPPLLAQDRTEHSQGQSRASNSAR